MRFLELFISLLSFISASFAQDSELYCVEDPSQIYREAYACYRQTCGDVNYFDTKEILSERLKQANRDPNFRSHKTYIDGVLNRAVEDIKKHQLAKLDEIKKTNLRKFPKKAYRKCQAAIENSLDLQRKELGKLSNEQLVLAWQAEKNLTRSTEYRRYLPELKKKVLKAIFGEDPSMLPLFDGIDVDHITKFNTNSINQWRAIVENESNLLEPKPYEVKFDQINDLHLEWGCEQMKDKKWLSLTQVQRYLDVLKTFTGANDEATNGGDIRISGWALKDRETFEAMWSHEFTHIVEIYLKGKYSTEHKKTKGRIGKIKACMVSNFSLVGGVDIYENRSDETFADEVSNLVNPSGKPFSCAYANINDQEFQEHLEIVSSSTNPSRINESKKFLDKFARNERYDEHLTTALRVALTSLHRNSSSGSPCRAYLTRMGLSSERVAFKNCFEKDQN